MMRLDLTAENEASESSKGKSTAATPELSLYKLPSKQREQPLVMFTPPITSSAASVPFLWEEVPGKLRPDFKTTTASASSPPALQGASRNKNSVARCLDLPPRLLNDTCSTMMITDHQYPPTKQSYSSPTTVLHGPNNAPSFSRTTNCTFSLTKSSSSTTSAEACFRSLQEPQFVREVENLHPHNADIDELHRGVNGKRNATNNDDLAAERLVGYRKYYWGSYKENMSSSTTTSTTIWRNNNNNNNYNDNGRFYSSTSTGDDDGHDDGSDFTSSFAVLSHDEIRTSSGKLRRLIRRRSSFLSLSRATSSNLIAGIYGSLKQVVSWRRRQGQSKE